MLNGLGDIYCHWVNIAQDEDDEHIYYITIKRREPIKPFVLKAYNAQYGGKEIVMVVVVKKDSLHNEMAVDVKNRKQGQL